MKLWEALKALDENPNKVFDSGKRIIVNNGEGKIVVQKRNENGGVLFSYQDANDDWQEAKQPVTWQEAIKAWGSGRTIRLHMPGWELTLKPTNAVELNHCRITDGTWYIED